MPFKLELPLIRFGEFDLGGVLYHANYFHLLESGREALLKDGPRPYLTLVKEGSHLAISESRQKFIKPIHYGEKVTIELSFSEIKKASATLQYKISNHHLAHLAETKLVFVKSSNGVFSVTPFPDDLKNYFLKFKETSLFG